MHIKRENETEKDRERSVFSTVFLALVAVLAVEISMLLLSFTLSGFTSRLNSNAEQILDKQVVNRAAYISGQLIEAQDLSGLDSAVNRAAAQLVQEGETVASLTSSNEGSAPLFDAVSDQMVRILREKNVTGVYIVLHTGKLSRTAGGSLPCLYLRDLDPSAPASATNDDLLLEHAPAAVMHRMSISTSENWEPGIPVTGGAQDDFFRLPYDRAREDGGIQNAADYGRWSTESYTLAGDSRPVISYTQPLIYPDGTVYGVIGVELLTRYVQSLLPYSELQNDGFGTYLLARSPDTTQDSSMTLHSVVNSAADWPGRSRACRTRSPRPRSSPRETFRACRAPASRSWTALRPPSPTSAAASSTPRPAFSASSTWRASSWPATSCGRVRRSIRRTTFFPCSAAESRRASCRRMILKS